MISSLIRNNFVKIKGEVDTLERTKDEESKKFQAHNIHFDFNVLVKIKESMVDVSSSCMELALKVQDNFNPILGNIYLPSESELTVKLPHFVDEKEK